jgi:phage-related protein
MATFDDGTVGTSTGGTTPDFGAQRKSQPVVRSAKFGDGYEQRVQFGINQDPKTWDLRWSTKSNTDATKIEQFFEARRGVESFDWTPIGSSTSYKWLCRTWQREFQYADINTVSATFEQVFEP